MSSDRFVKWKDHRPTQSDIERALTDYLGEGIGRIEVKRGDPYIWWIIVRINGTPSDPRKHIRPELVHSTSLHQERWFEVIWGEDTLDVLTRNQDPLVCAIADGFVKFCCLYWEAKAAE